MAFALTVWRAAALSISVEEFLDRVAPLVFDELHAKAVVVRVLETAPPSVHTLAAIHVGVIGASTLLAPRQPIREADFVKIRDGLASAIRFQGTPRRGASWLRTMLAGLESHDESGWTVLPLVHEGNAQGVAAFAGDFDPNDERLSTLQEAGSAVLASQLYRRNLERVREAAEADKAAALGRLQLRDVSPSVIGEDAGLRGVMEQVTTVAPTDAPVLILGETGSGKEVVARAIHERSRRRDGPVLRVNCGAIPAELVDSELFGHERGAFTGAASTRVGWFERADGGTLFLDEIGELPPAAQVRLLRVLQDGVYERVGGQRPLTADVRVVAATHRDLPQMVRAGQFREDLWYRIAVFTVRLPPLRERKGDIPALVNYIATTVGHRYGSGPLQPSLDDLELLARYDWPGNVRELGAVIERAAVLGEGKRLEVARALGAVDGTTAPSAVPVPPSRAIQPLDEVNRAAITHALQVTRGRIDGPRGAARALGLHANTLRSRMAKLGIPLSSQFGPAAADAE